MTETMTSETMTWHVLVAAMNHLWQSTLVVLAAWLLCRIVLAPNHPRVRFAVWLAASLKFLIPFSLFVALGQQLGVRPVLTTTQSQQVFHFVSDRPGIMDVVPFQAGMAARTT